MTRLMTLCMVLGLLACAAVASADVYGSMAAQTWDATPFISDPAGDQSAGGAGRDIYQGLWWQRDGTHAYFRMDLSNRPVGPSSTDWAEIYGIYLDGVAGGGNGASLNYAPDEYNGIDYIVDLHWVDPGSGPVPNDVHFHVWNGSAFSFSSLAATEYRMEYNLAGTNRFEWRIPNASLSANYVIGGATIEQGDAQNTWDYTDLRRTPEPGTMALMGLGMAGLAAWRKRKK